MQSNGVAGQSPTTRSRSRWRYWRAINSTRPSSGKMWKGDASPDVDKTHRRPGPGPWPVPGGAAGNRTRSEKRLELGNAGGDDVGVGQSTRKHLGERELLTASTVAGVEGATGDECRDPPIACRWWSCLEKTPQHPGGLFVDLHALCQQIRGGLIMGVPDHGEKRPGSTNHSFLAGDEVADHVGGTRG